MASLRQQIAQMLVIGFAGTELTQQSPITKCLSQEGLGGVILFDYDLINKRPGKNLVSQEQIKQLTTQLASYAQTASKIPLFIAIDYEGGAVDRLRHVEGCMSTIKPCDMARLDDQALRLEAGKMAQTLKKLGFNLNFAPVVDLNLNEEEGIIGKLGRSFASHSSAMIHTARQFVKVFAEHGIAACYKHFPGHGSATGDTHEGFVDVTETFQADELEPYRILLKEKLPAMIMTAHVINRHLDPSGLPATLSKTILTDLLRQEFAYDGVIISDDLQMHAISKHYSLDASLRLTINAGADMIIFGNQLGEISATEVIDRIEHLVNTRVIAQQRIEEAYRRILHLKSMLAL